MTAAVEEAPAQPDAASGGFSLDAYLRQFSADALSRSPEYRRLLAKIDPMLFALLYLPHHLRGPETSDRVTFSEFHLELIEQAKRWIVPNDRPGQHRDVYVAPRGCGKSTWFFTILPMWAAAFGHRKFIAAFADSGNQAELHLQTFKRELDTNELLRRDFPDLCIPAKRPRGSTESDNRGMLITKSGFVFGAKGIDSSSLGMKVGQRRPDLILCHLAGTPMLHGRQWIPVEEHPSFHEYREDESRTVRVWGLPFEEVVTPEHRYWAKWVNGRRAKSRPADWCEAQNLDGYHYIGTPIDMSVEPPPTIPVWRRRIGERGPDGRVTSGAVYGTEFETPECFNDPEFWWVVGLWWGDGHIGSRSTVGITMSNAYPELKERLLRYITKIGRVPTVIDRQGCQQVLWSHVDIKSWLRTWKKEGFARKTPPEWVERLPLGFQENLVEGYADADGWRTEDGVRVTSVHLDGLLSLRRILARLGRASTIRKGAGPRVEKFSNGYTSTSQQKYDLRWSLRQERYAINRTHIADGFLWNKVRSVEVGGVEKFAPIRTDTSSYVTAFGLSHNCDDVEPDESNYSPYQKEKRLSTLLDAILPLNVYARVVLVGTVTMPGSIVHDLVKTATKPGEEHPAWIRDENWRVHYYPAIVRDEETGAERSIWPAKWPMTYLQSIRHTRAFKKNYQNDPLGRDGDYWNADDFVHVEIPALTHQLLSIDPAVTSKGTSDFTALAVIGYSALHRRCVVRYAMARRIQPGEPLRQWVLNVLEEFPEIRGVVVETNQGGDVWRNAVLKGLPVPIKTVHQKEPKEVRAARLLNWYQRRPPAGPNPILVDGVSAPYVVHEHPLPALEEQMVGFPKAAFDDLVDTVGTGVDMFLKRGKKADVVVTSPGGSDDDDD